MPLPESVQRGIEAAGFVTCTPIQEKTLPTTLDGHDIAGQAQTGTGKTAAFLITTFTRLLRSDSHGAGHAGPRALIIAPTRELVVQILHDAELLGQFTGLRMIAVYGGVDYEKQRKAVQAGCDLLVGTPGRLIDYFKQHAYSLKHAEVLVVDEADRMFDMGFIADLRFLLRRLPSVDKRQSMLFSATLSWDVMELAYEHMNNPAKVEIQPEQITAEGVEQTLYHVGLHEKLPLLLGLFQREKPERVLIFVNMKRDAETLVRRLEDNGWHACALTGDVHQKERLKVLRQLKAGEVPILVCTDVASRGLHIDGVTHVFNWDLPQDPEDYVHRVGRTARAGASGKAISLACEDYVMGLEAIEKMLGAKIPCVDVHDDMLVKPAPRSHRPRPRPAEQPHHAPAERSHPPAAQPRRRRRSGSGSNKAQ